MKYQINVAREAGKVLDRLGRPTERRIRQRIILVAEDPLAARLSAPLTERGGLRKSRAGGWRILFAVDRATKVIYIVTVDTRGQEYKHS